MFDRSMDRLNTPVCEFLFLDMYISKEKDENLLQNLSKRFPNEHGWNVFNIQDTAKPADWLLKRLHSLWLVCRSKYFFEDVNILQVWIHWFPVLNMYIVYKHKYVWQNIVRIWYGKSKHLSSQLLFELYKCNTQVRLSCVLVWENQTNDLRSITSG